MTEHKEENTMLGLVQFKTITVPEQLNPKGEKGITYIFGAPKYRNSRVAIQLYMFYVGFIGCNLNNS